MPSTPSTHQTIKSEYEVTLTTKQLGGMTMPSIVLDRIAVPSIDEAREFTAMLAREHAERLPVAIEQLDEDRWRFVTHNATEVTYSCRRAAARQ